ncbi:MAG: hypothetical protein HY749_00285 [Gammaproteobacteria bacterium]|nr:hypothetical protein [Gammaproteobacteria bacterium]
MIEFRMRKIPAAVAAVVIAAPLAAHAGTGPSSSATPYLLATQPGYTVTSLLTVGDSVGGYRLGGIPDGLGAYDNGNGTFTLLVNHEWSAGAGSAHGVLGAGAYVSKWIVDKSTLSVVSGSNLIQSVATWNSATQASDPLVSTPAAIAFNRFCSADLAATSALSYLDTNTNTTYGTTERLFMTGEEGGTGRAVATIVNSGEAYVLGKFNLASNGSGGTAVGGWENILVNPLSQMKTVAVGTNDGGTGIMTNALAVYVGTKTETGSEVDKAGLTNGVTKFVNVAGNPAEIVNTTSRATNIVDGTRFTLSDTASTTFSRPEDGVWNPGNANQFFFVTTDRLDQVAEGLGTQVGRTRLWSMTFDDITNPDAGGKIDMLAEGTGLDGNMWDNMTVDVSGHLILQEDPGNTPHNGKVWDYDPATGTMTQILKADPARVGDVGLAATAPFNVDEESSGVIDVTDIFDASRQSGRYYLLTSQMHYATGDLATVEGGQLLLVHAVPLPGAVWLLGSALAGLGGLRRRIGC